MAYKSFLNDEDLVRGLRNNNPCNLIYTAIDWEGKIPYSQNKDFEDEPKNIKKKFEQFVDLRHGIRAGMRNLITRIKEGNSITSLITGYAPNHDNNDTKSYISFVSNALSLAPYALLELSEDTVLSLTKVIITMEIGVNAAKMITEQDYRDALAILGVPLKKKSSNQKIIIVLAVVLIAIVAYKIYKNDRNSH